MVKDLFKMINALVVTESRYIRPYLKCYIYKDLVSIVFTVFTTKAKRSWWWWAGKLTCGGDCGCHYQARRSRRTQCCTNTALWRTRKQLTLEMDVSGASQTFHEVRGVT